MERRGAVNVLASHRGPCGHQSTHRLSCRRSVLITGGRMERRRAIDVLAAHIRPRRHQSTHRLGGGRSALIFCSCVQRRRSIGVLAAHVYPRRQARLEDRRGRCCTLISGGIVQEASSTAVQWLRPHSLQRPHHCCRSFGAHTVRRGMVGGPGAGIVVSAHLCTSCHERFHRGYGCSCVWT